MLFLTGHLLCLLLCTSDILAISNRKFIHRYRVSLFLTRERYCRFNDRIASHAGSLSYVWLSRHSLFLAHLSSMQMPCCDDKSVLSVETAYTHTRSVRVEFNSKYNQAFSTKSVNQTLVLTVSHHRVQFCSSFYLFSRERERERVRTWKKGKRGIESLCRFNWFPCTWTAR